VLSNAECHPRLAPEQVAQFLEDVRAHGAAAFTGCYLHVEKTRGSGNGPGPG
jgi:hypothetical protein